MTGSRGKSPIRSDMRNLEQNGIAGVSFAAFGRPDVIPLWYGEGDLVTPDFIRDAAKKALDEGKTFYTYPRGIVPLREAIAAYHRRTIDVAVDVERITVPGAAMMAVMVALQCLVESGDEVAVITPVWPSIFQAAEIAGAKCKFVRLIEDWDAATPHWRLDMDALAAACGPRTKAIFVCSPGNPTGWVMTRDEQRAMLEFARERGIGIISDEVYGTLVYDGAQHAPSFLEVADPDDAVFVVNSFSKPWAMTGWRIGWLTHPRSMAMAMDTLSMCNNTGATVFGQYGALAALSPKGDAFREEMRARCRRGRDVVEQFIAGNNRLRWMRPEGAFYGFLAVDGMTDSLGFASKLALEGGVGVAPGSAFGPQSEKANDSYLRICFAQDDKRLAEGLDRLARGANTMC
jgi:aspartate/methionine/tyrosine aminotransferase